MTYRVVMACGLCTITNVFYQLAGHSPRSGVWAFGPMVVWSSFWCWRVILCCRVQNKNTLTYCIYTYIRCCYAVMLLLLVESFRLILFVWYFSCKTRLNLKSDCFVLYLLDSVVWSLFNRISFLVHVLIWTISLCRLAFVEIDFGRISTGFRWNP